MKMLIFGATGTAVGSVLSVCLSFPIIEEVRAISRRPFSVSNNKIARFFAR